MKFKLYKKATKETKEEIKATLEEILHKLENDEQLYMGEVVYLQSHKRDIKKLFPDEPILWENAMIPEEEWNNKGASKKSIKSGESYGWVVNPEDAWDKLWLFVDAVGEKEALEALARAMGNVDLSDNLAYIFRMYDFKEGCSDYGENEEDWEVDYADKYDTEEEAREAYKQAIKDFPEEEHVLYNGDDLIEEYKGKGK